MADMRSYNREFVAEFIELYKSEECLWKYKSKHYSNKNIRNMAYDKLLQKMKHVDHNASSETVIKRINSLRTCFRKELKKVLACEKSGAGVEDQYVPQLWYYGSLMFLCEQDEPRSSSSSNILTEPLTTDGVEIHEVDEEFVPPPSITIGHSPVKKKFKKSKTTDKADAILDLVAQSLQGSQDGPLDLFGKYIASQLMQLPDAMVILTQKLINSALYEAKIGNVCKASRIVHSDNSDSASWCSGTPAEVMTSGIPFHSSISNSENTSADQENSRDSNHIDFDASMDEEIPLDDETLILKVQEYPAIYDSKCRSHKDNKIKEKYWREIASELDYSVNSCRNKWETLTSRFWNTHKLVRIAQKKQSKIKLWKWYNAMSYLLSGTDDSSEMGSEKLYDMFHHQRVDYSRSSRQREHISKIEYDSSLTLGNEDEAFFISLLPTVSKFDIDDKLDFRGDVLNTVRKIKRSSKSRNSSSCTNNDQNVLITSRARRRQDSELVCDRQDENFVSVKQENNAEMT